MYNKLALYALVLYIQNTSFSLGLHDPHDKPSIFSVFLLYHLHKRDNLVTDIDLCLSSLVLCNDYILLYQ